MADGASTLKIAAALSELAKGMKSVSFYPDGHPSLIQSVSKIVAVLEELPLPEAGLEVEVTRGALLYGGEPLPVTNRAVYDLNRELFLRRVSKIIFLPELKGPEVIAFLKVLGRDIREIQDEGGIERVMLREKVSRIWANRVDYEGLTEMLKREAEPEPEEALEAEDLKTAEVSLDGQHELPLEDVTIEVLLSLIERETDPSAYRDHVANLIRELLAEPQERRIEYASRALSIFAAQLDNPPSQGNEEIAKLAQLGRIEVDLDDADVVRTLARIQVWPLTREVAQASTRLDIHSDRADEIIAATSVVHQVPLLTRDRRLLKSRLIPLVRWRTGT